MAGHFRGRSCEDISGECVLTTSAQGISVPRVARMSEGKVARPPRGMVSPRSELRGRLRRKWPDHPSSGHLGTQSCEDVSGESGRTTMEQSISEVRVARMSEAKVARPPQLRESRNPELQGCLGTMRQGISDIRVARMSQAKMA